MQPYSPLEDTVKCSLLSYSTSHWIFQNIKSRYGCLWAILKFWVTFVPPVRRNNFFNESTCRWTLFPNVHWGLGVWTWVVALGFYWMACFLLCFHNLLYNWKNRSPPWLGLRGSVSLLVGEVGFGNTLEYVEWARLTSAAKRRTLHFGFSRRRADELKLNLWQLKCTSTHSLGLLVAATQI